VLYIILFIVVVTGISAWITASRMERKVGQTLGRKATKEDLTSLSTWIDVAKVEELNQGKKPQG
jgi:hypothetical protein